MKLESTVSSSECALLSSPQPANGLSSSHIDQNGMPDNAPQTLGQNGLMQSHAKCNKREYEAEQPPVALTADANEQNLRQTVSQTDIAASASASTPHRPLGTRKRKKTKMFEMAAPTQVRRVSTGALGVPGRGEKLCNIPNILYNIDKANSKDAEIEFLHRLLFNFVGSAHTRKSNIRSFSGFVFASEKDRNRVRGKLMRAHLNMVRKMAKFLDVPVKKLRPSSSEANRESVANTSTGVNGTETAKHSVAVNAEKGAILAEAMGMGDDETREICGAGKAANKKRYPPPKDAREITMIAGKEDLVRALLEFLEMPRAIEGRESLAERDKELRRQKKAAEKAAEKARAEKAALKKAAERKAALLKKKEVRESDEDGDEDLETGGTTWIELARQWKEARAREESPPKRNGFLTTNGHG
eukprot:TRINITY_DN48204_c0_g1_i1.p1 TRINITY_DN48204_c0_g1~~TRINITY_DN48204_c0_g1_i1.p1  ORF type:complete len:415 (-),score=92.69 TRINITY_DN48204_c0_g1_i1:1388-2632(-)